MMVTMMGCQRRGLGRGIRRSHTVGSSSDDDSKGVSKDGADIGGSDERMRAQVVVVRGCWGLAPDRPQVKGPLERRDRWMS